MPPRALIFDMDETLVASGSVWQRAERQLSARLGQEYDPVLAQRYKGMNALDVGSAIHAQLQPAEYSAPECGRLLRELLCAEFRGALTAMPGADMLLRRVTGHYPLAIASGSPLEAIRLVLARFQWTDFFALLVSSESVARGKPAPDVFLAAAQGLGCPAETCLVFEDSLHGVRAARAAGMHCFVVPSSADATIRLEANRCFASLAEITPDDILAAMVSTAAG